MNRINKSLKPYLRDAKVLKIPSLEASEVLRGHTDFVEDVVFNPTDDRILISSG